MRDQDLPPESEFDLRARAELALAFDPGQAPASLLRHTPLWSRRGFQHGLAACFVSAGGAGAVLAARPPALVCGAIAHELDERLLRGSMMSPRDMLARIGLADAQRVPGFPQLMRPCNFNGQLVYHLTTFFEGGGMVTVFAFDQPVVLGDGTGWWSNAHWQVMRSPDGRPLVLVAAKKRALAVAAAALSSTPKPAG
ncbi:MAG: hypothetical protein H7Z19_08560 [Chitinophagaceae bacterium]|nr:hypothetical protein [Rubrivivax sp.]